MRWARGAILFKGFGHYHEHLAVLTFDFAALNINNTVVLLACRHNILQAGPLFRETTHLRFHR